jgi:hypothetical protein
MNILKRISKLTPLLAITIMMLCSNAFANTAPWTSQNAYGMFAGTDSHGGIICVNITGICFTVYYQAEPDPGGPGPIYDPGKIVAIWLQTTNYGLVDINGMTVDNLSYGDVYTPLTDENTQEVTTEQEVINWMNANYGE